MYERSVNPDICVTMNSHSCTDIVNKKYSIFISCKMPHDIAQLV